VSWLGATLVLLAPLNAWNVAITTDIPLMLFSFAAIAAWLQALRTGRHGWGLLAGLMLGGALLSKYFAGMLALGMLGHALTHRDARTWKALGWLVLGALPSAGLQIAWNAQWCWPNLMFNLVNRHAGAAWSWTQPLLYVVSVGYVFTPVVAGVLGRLAFDAIRGPARRRADGSAPPGTVPAARSTPEIQAMPEAVSALAWAVAFPLAVFALLTMRKVIGLHWLAEFVAPAIMLFVLLPDRAHADRRWGSAWASPRCTGSSSARPHWCRWRPTGPPGPIPGS
jgi:hypothetical protein